MEVYLANKYEISIDQALMYAEEHGLGLISAELTLPGVPTDLYGGVHTLVAKKGVLYINLLWASCRLNSRDPYVITPEVTEIPLSLNGLRPFFLPRQEILGLQGPNIRRLVISPGIVSFCGVSVAKEITRKPRELHLGVTKRNDFSGIPRSGF
jgi:hypothetical protein